MAGFEWLNDLEVSNIVGDGEAGGYSASFSFYNDQAAPQLMRQIEFYHRNFSRVTWEAADRLAFRGVLTPQSLDASRSASRVTAIAHTYHHPLGQIPLSGCSFENSAAGAHNHQINGLNLGKVIEHLSTEHVTITGGIDISQVETTSWADPGATDGTSPLTVYVVRESASLWQAMRNVADDEFFILYFDRLNRLVYKQHPQFASTTPSVVAELDNTILLSPYRVDYRTEPGPRNVMILGLTSNFTVLESTYPAGAGVDVRGQRFEIRCESQARLDALAYRMYNWLNRDYTATIALPGAWPFELYDHVELTLSGTATNGVTFSWSEKSFYVRRVEYRKVQTFGWVTTLTLDEAMV